MSIESTSILATGGAGQLGVFLGLLLVCLVSLVPLAAGLYLLHYLLTLPMRRNERCRIFLDLLELGLKQGQAPEVAITEAASSGDRILGKHFQAVAEHTRSGLRLSQALHLTPRLVPPQVRAMLKTGERIGDIAKVLPACRLLLRDSVSQVRGAINYLIVLSIIGVPFSIFVPVMLKVKVLPVFKEVFAGMSSGVSLPPFTSFVLAQNSVFITIQVSLFAAVWLITLVYLGGPRLKDLLENVHLGEGRSIDWLAMRLPWRRKRLQRDFSSMLALLLESGVPESEAVRLAGESTANWVMKAQAGQVCARLEKGVPLPEALQTLDDSAELGWRLTNALRRGKSFVDALGGWHEALDARAFQLEQSAAQLATTIIVLINGALVAALVIAMFLPLIRLMNEAVLW